MAENVGVKISLFRDACRVLFVIGLATNIVGAGRTGERKRLVRAGVA